jgi:hypothetical protein
MFNIPLILIPSKKKILFYSFVFLSFATACFFIEVITNKITQGTHLIRFYESVIFYLLAAYYLVQLIPGYAKFMVDDKGFKETWFFRQRIKILWLSIDSTQSKQLTSGDTLYLNTEKGRLFSRKMVCKGCYNISDSQLYQNFIKLKQLNPLFNKATKGTVKDTVKGSYLVLGRMRLILLVTFSLIIILFNSYYLSNENPDKDFIQQVDIWKEEARVQGKLQTSMDKQLFESFKVYGFYWKQQLKQFDRQLFHRVLLQESIQIEKALFKQKIKQKESTQVMLEAEKLKFKDQLLKCKDNYLFYDEIKYLQCLENL